MPLHESLKVDQGCPLHLDVLRGNRVRFYLMYLSRNATQNLDTLFDLALVGVAHTLRPLHDLSHRILRVLARSGAYQVCSSPGIYSLTSMPRWLQYMFGR